MQEEIKTLRTQLKGKKVEKKELWNSVRDEIRVVKDDMEALNSKLVDCKQKLGEVDN